MTAHQFSSAFSTSYEAYQAHVSIFHEASRNQTSERQNGGIKPIALLTDAFRMVASMQSQRQKELHALRTGRSHESGSHSVAGRRLDDGDLALVASALVAVAAPVLAGLLVKDLAPALLLHDALALCECLPLCRLARLRHWLGTRQRRGRLWQLRNAAHLQPCGPTCSSSGEGS